VPAIAPAMVGRGQNRYYATDEEYVFAIAEALRTEYRAIVDAGFVLQIDDPGLGETWDMLIPPPPLEEYRRTQARNIDALNHALSGIPEDRVRYHLCWGSWQGPHVHDLGLRDIVDLLLRVRAQAYSVEAATPRHSYEWRVWQDVKLPEGKILIPGVIAHTTAVVEHPETIAERIVTFARVVGPERVIAGGDCGFAQGALYERQHPAVMWAKLEALVEGARLAYQRL
jgi:5-methyltetrahydropteroyltriglutamate--homocysteine methyltransferase